MREDVIDLCSRDIYTITMACLAVICTVDTSIGRAAERAFSLENPEG